MVLLLLCVYCKELEVKKKLIKDILKFKDLVNVNLIVCWPIRDVANIIREFFDGGIRVIKCEEDIKDCFSDIDFNVGLVIDARCDGYVDITTEVSCFFFD